MDAETVRSLSSQPEVGLAVGSAEAVGLADGLPAGWVVPGFSYSGEPLALAAGVPELRAPEIAANPPTARASTSSRIAPTKSRRRR